VDDTRSTTIHVAVVRPIRHEAPSLDKIPALIDGDETVPRSEADNLLPLSGGKAPRSREEVMRVSHGGGR